MQQLLVFLDDLGAIDEERARVIVASLDSTGGLRDRDVEACAWEADYAVEGDWTTIRLSEDRKRLSVHGSGPASCDFIARFASRYGPGLRLTDGSYSFDESLDGRRTAADIEQWISEGDHRD